VGVPDRIRKLASVAGVSTAVSGAPIAVRRAAPSSAAPGCPSASGANVSAAAMAAGVTVTDVPSTTRVRSDAVAGVATSVATRWTSARLTSGRWWSPERHRGAVVQVGRAEVGRGQRGHAVPAYQGQTCHRQHRLDDPGPAEPHRPLDPLAVQVGREPVHRRAQPGPVDGDRGLHLLASGHGLEQVDGVPAAGPGGGQGGVDVEARPDRAGCTTACAPPAVTGMARWASSRSARVRSPRPGSGLAPDVDAADRGAAGDARAGREVQAGPHHDDQTEHAEAGDQQPSVHPGQEVLP
jgi:hypothetical protein